MKPSAARRRTLVTGGTGFIGINLTDALVQSNRELLIVARHPPRCVVHQSFFATADVRDLERLRQLIRDFAPNEIIHLAAQTDFVTWEDAEGFRINTEGTLNLLRAIKDVPSVRRFIFASSHVVDGAKKNHARLYAQSKIAGEDIVRAAYLPECSWTIIRPCSIWGPWFGAPFFSFFVTIARGRYYHLGRIDPPKRIGYVGNTCHHVMQLLDAPAERVHKQTFYLADYQPTRIRTWAGVIARHLGVRIPGTLPEPAVRAVAWAGDVLKRLGVRNPPLSSVRLANMRADTSGITIDEIHRLAGPLPFTLEQGVEATVRWLRYRRVVA
jgi:nucleoside-diphosphate-sugar epimerase